MSFSSDVKEELCRVEPVCSHCQNAVLAALIRIEGSLFLSGGGKHRLEFATDAGNIARLMVRSVHELYGLKTETVMRQSVLHKTPNYLIKVPSQEGLDDVLVKLGILSPSGGLEMGIAPSLIKKQCCAAAYVRGAFLGSGFISNPRGDFHFEISVESEEMAQGIIDILDTKGINAKTMKRRNAYIVYMKSGSAISEFLAFVGAHKGACSMEEVRVYKSIRNDVNRQTNAEIANQAKSASAAVDQLFAIRTVVDAYGIESLPPALREFIRLRVANPDASLKELGEKSKPPLSKSAVAHRVRRIEELARQVESGQSYHRP